MMTSAFVKERVAAYMGSTCTCIVPNSEVLQKSTQLLRFRRKGGLPPAKQVLQQ